MGLVKQSGARYMRETFYWRLAQPNGAYFDPAWLQAADRLVAAAADSGVVLQITLATTPGWVRGNDCDPTHAQDPNYRVPGDNSCNSYNSSWYPPYPNMWIWYRNYIGDLVARYGDRVKYWGIWNEPNTSDFLKLPPNGDYADWTQVYDWMWGYAADVIPNTPDVSMIGPEIGIGADPNATALEAFMWRSGYRLRPQDIVGIHFYGLEYPTGPSSMETLVRSHDAVLSRWGVGNKIWMTEEGLGQPETDDAVQANSVAQALTAFNQTSVARWTAIFRFHLWSPAQTDFYDEWLVKNALTTPIVRPGYYCFQAFARGFERPYGCQP